MTTPAAAPDLVYVVRPGDDNEELRYSLRSVAANLPHGRVWIVGTVPSWVRNVSTISLEPNPEKWANIRQSVSAAANHPDISDVFAVFNDDHFVMRPIEHVAAYHVGTVSQFSQACRDQDDITPHNSTWMLGISQTAEFVGGDPLCYEGHVPLLFNRTRLAAALERYPADRLLAYPGLYPIAGAAGPGVQGSNCKVIQLGGSELLKFLSSPMPYLSTLDDSFSAGAVGDFIRDHFPNPGPYEEAP